MRLPWGDTIFHWCISKENCDDFYDNILDILEIACHIYDIDETNE